MAHSSIGTASGGDSNENHDFDDLPSKTMGAESDSGSSGDDNANSGCSTDGESDSGDASRALTESDLASPDLIAGANPFATDDGNPANFPDVPNVATSPSENMPR